VLKHNLGWAFFSASMLMRDRTLIVEIGLSQAESDFCDY
jgi:hypothetical protein